MIELKTPPAEFKFTIEVKSKETGEVTAVQMVGFADKQKLKEYTHKRDAQHRSAQHE